MKETILESSLSLPGRKLQQCKGFSLNGEKAIPNCRPTFKAPARVVRAFKRGGAHRTFLLPRGPQRERRLSSWQGPRV